MLTKKIILRTAGASLAAIALLTPQPLRAQASSDAARLEKLEHAVELLEKQNAELKAEVSSLKKHTEAAPVVAGEGKTKTQITYDGKTYVEKTAPLEKSAADKCFFNDMTASPFVIATNGLETASGLPTSRLNRLPTCKCTRGWA